MQATLTWLDLTASDRDKMRRVLDLFKEQGTLDEMGLGSLRDVLSDALFPGTSSIQTRLRYALFIPWIYQRLEDTEGQGHRGAASRAEGRGRSHRPARTEPGQGGDHRLEGSQRAGTVAEFRLLERAHAVGHISAPAEPGLVPLALRRARGWPRRCGASGRSGRDLEPASALASATTQAAGGISLGSVIRVDP